MALPQLSEKFTFIKKTLPSGKSIGCRSWKVKDEKALLLAIEADEDDSRKVNHIVDFLRGCVDDAALFDKLSETDLKKIAVEIRKMSKGDLISYSVKCKNEECNHRIEDAVVLSKNETIKTFDKTTSVISDKLSVTFKEVSFVKGDELFEKFGESSSTYTFKFLANSIEAFTYDDEVYTEFTPEEMERFMDDLESNELEKLYVELDKKTANVSIDKAVTCIKCKTKTEVSFGNLFDFLVF